MQRGVIELLAHLAPHVFEQVGPFGSLVQRHFPTDAHTSGLVLLQVESRNVAVLGEEEVLSILVHHQSSGPFGTQLGGHLGFLGP